MVTGFCSPVMEMTEAVLAIRVENLACRISIGNLDRKVSERAVGDPWSPLVSEVMGPALVSS